MGISPVFYFLLQNGDKRQQILPVSASYIHPAVGKAMTAIPNQSLSLNNRKGDFQYVQQEQQQAEHPRGQGRYEQVQDGSRQRG